MLTVNFNAYASYVTDSLYQWDINQKLSVQGLNLSVAPEVHFSNATMDKAIVRQATLENNIVNVDIPNSLLQMPFKITAHIGVYSGKTFKVIEKVEIPIKPKPRPADYQIEDSGEEVYSFRALENAIAQMATKNQVANIIAHNNDTEGNTELIDVRVGYDGTIYGSAGEAVREQTLSSIRYTPQGLTAEQKRQVRANIGAEQSEKTLPSTFFFGGESCLNFAEVSLSEGYFISAGGVVTSSSGYCYGYIDVFNTKRVIIDTTGISDATLINFANENKNHLSNYHNWGSPDLYEINVPRGVRYICISCKFSDADKINVTLDTVSFQKSTEEKLKRVIDLTPKTFLTGGNSEINFSDVDLIDDAYILATGGCITNKEYCYGYIDVFNAKAITVEMVNMIDTAVVNATDENKTLITCFLNWKGSGTYNLTDLPENTRYICISCKKVDIDGISVTIDNKGILGDFITDKEDSTRRVSSYMRTRDARFIKGVHLDCGRKYFSVANIKKLLDEMHNAKLNTFQIYFSDNEGFRFGLDDMNITVDDVVYDLSVALGDGRAPTDGSGKWLTQSEMDEIIAYAEAYDIEVIPAFDMPGHFGAIRDKFSGLEFQEATDHGRRFMVEILKKYASYFATKGCRYYNICGDETSISSDIYEKFMDMALYEIAKLNMTPLFYNDSVCKDGYFNPYLTNEGIVLGWIRRATHSDYNKIDNCGYRMINAAANNYHYWILNENEKPENLPDLIRNADIFLMADGSKMYNIVGSIYHIWCDLADMHGADEGAQIIAETEACISAFGEAVNRAVPTDRLCVIDSPDGSKFRLDVADNGTLSATKL